MQGGHLLIYTLAPVDAWAHSHTAMLKGITVGIYKHTLRDDKEPSRQFQRVFMIGLGQGLGKADWWHL